MRVYVASSWRNKIQPGIVQLLRRMKLEVYDFRHPEPGNDGFRWLDIDPAWQSWTPAQWRAALQHPIAVRGYELDMRALMNADVCVLVLPAGRSASFEAGVAFGMGKRVIVYADADESVEPELMFREAKIVTNADELFAAFGWTG